MSPKRPGRPGMHARRLTVLAAGLALCGAVPLSHAPDAGSAVASGGAPPMPSSQRVALTWAALYMSDNHAYSAAEANSLASRFDLVAAMPVALKPYAASMRQTNPDLTLVAYTAATLLGKGKASGVPEAAFAHDRAGRRITYLAFDHWLMEGTNPTWMQMANAECARRSTSAGFDGCLVDMLGTGVISAKGAVSSLPAAPATGITYTEAQYRLNMKNLYAFYRQHDPASVHVGNAVGNSFRYWLSPVTSRVLTDSMPAAQMEDFLRGAGDPATSFPTAENWKLNVDVIRDFEGKGRAGLFTTKLWSPHTAAQTARWQKFAMASFLMGAHGRSYFAFTHSRDKAGASQSNLPYSMPKNIGLPTSGMTRLDSGAFRRTFSNGVALVNPTTSVVTVALPSALRSLDGNRGTSVTLGAHTGEVLVEQ